jgi:hypothetical protein
MSGESGSSSTKSLFSLLKLFSSSFSCISSVLVSLLIISPVKFNNLSKKKIEIVLKLTDSAVLDVVPPPKAALLHLSLPAFHLPAPER